MLACTLSNLELRNIIETAFLPMRCNCYVVDERMTVDIVDPATEHVQLHRAGIGLERLDTSRALCDLILELRRELHDSQNMSRHALAS